METWQEQPHTVCHETTQTKAAFSREKNGDEDEEEEEEANYILVNEKQEKKTE